MDNGLAVSLAAAIGGSGVAGAFVTAIINRKKLGADATKVLTEAASSFTADVRADNVDLRHRIVELERKQQTHDGERERWDRIEHEIRETLTVHSAFDQWVAQRLRDLGIDVGPVPPLLPPSMRTP